MRINWQSMSVLVIDYEPGLNGGSLPVAVSRAWIRRYGEQPAFLRSNRWVIPRTGLHVIASMAPASLVVLETASGYRIEAVGH